MEVKHLKKLKRMIGTAITLKENLYRAEDKVEKLGGYTEDDGPRRRSKCARADQKLMEAQDKYAEMETKIFRYIEQMKNL